MARPTTKESPNLPQATMRLAEVIKDQNLSRSGFAKRLGMSASGINAFFLKESAKISVVQAKAIELEFGVRAKWLLEGGSPKLVDRFEKLNKAERWLLDMSSPFEHPSFLTMWEIPLTLVTAAFQRKLLEMQQHLVFRKLIDHQVTKEVESWFGQILRKIKLDLEDLIVDLAVSDDEAQIFSTEFHAVKPTQLKQWLTGYYYLMDLSVVGPGDRISNEAEKMGLEIDLQWIDQHRSAFHSTWFGLCSRVEQALAEAS